MSDDIYHNVLNTEIQGTDRMEMMVAIYESGDNFRTQTDSNTNKQQPLPSTGSERVVIRSYKSVTVCLVLLCVLLLTAVIVLCVLLINTNNQQCQNKKLTEERDQLLTNYTNIIEERDELKAKYNIITKLNGWIYYQSSFYFISSEKKSWTESRSYCIEKGADLIIINNKEEQDFIKDYLVEDGHWIGLSDSDVEGRWKWVDGSTLTTSFWASEEPNGGNIENCAESYSSLWNDLACKNIRKWICERH
ncbi:CD209 antigen-like protein C [Misgurnus anguillicaudatus]|uniref:CD209 antigen-like protein C n=1 Tax=Misgurnus anguillicaudatus TaxID=75329 RepID=UPI003CCF5ACB